MDGYGYGGAGNPRDQITRALMQITAPPPQTRLPTPPPVPPRVPTMPAPGSPAYTAAMDNYNRGINDQMLGAPVGGAPLPGSPAYTAAMDNYNRGINDQMLGITAPVGAAPPGMPTPMGPPRVPTMPAPGAPQGLPQGLPQGPAPLGLPGQQSPYPPQY